MVGTPSCLYVHNMDSSRLPVRTFSNYLSTTSSDCKQPPSSCSSNPRPESSLLPTPTPCDLTSPLGEYPTCKIYTSPYLQNPISAPTAESVRNWVGRYLPGRPVPEVNRPTNWFAIILALTTVAGIGTTLVTLWPYIGPIIQHRRLWQFISLMTILGCTCGTMFNIIRNVPYAGHDGKGHVSFFAGGFQSQFQLESQIIGALCTSTLLRAFSRGFPFANITCFQTELSPSAPLVSLTRRLALVVSRPSRPWLSCMPVSCSSSTASFSASSVSRTAAIPLRCLPSYKSVRGICMMERGKPHDARERSHIRHGVIGYQKSIGIYA